MDDLRNTALDAIDNLNSVMDRIDKLNLDELEIEGNILENRIITLEGYLRFLRRDGIDDLVKLKDLFEGVNNGR
ncbi:MAG: hypothetical protein ACQEQG_02810 [Bacillota bacterium]